MNNSGAYNLNNINKDKNKGLSDKQKIALAAGLAIAVPAGVYAASQVIGNDSDAEEDLTLTPDDLISGAETVDTESQSDSGTADAPKTVESHNIVNTHETVYVEEHHHHHHNNSTTQNGPKENVGKGSVGEDVKPQSVEQIEETSLILDENGEFVAIADRGSHDGKSVTYIDIDGDGKADIKGYDANGDGIIDDSEVKPLADNDIHLMGQGKTGTVYVQTEEGLKFVTEMPIEDMRGLLALDPQMPQEDPKGNEISDITNDFHDEEKKGEGEEGENGENNHKGDLADNNPDYNNHGGEQYNAGNSNEASIEDQLFFEQDEDSNPEELQVDGLPAPEFQQMAYEDHGYSDPDIMITPDDEILIEEQEEIELTAATDSPEIIEFNSEPELYTSTEPEIESTEVYAQEDAPINDTPSYDGLADSGYSDTAYTDSDIDMGSSDADITSTEMFDA